MQRLISLAMLVGLLGGGWMYLNGKSLQDLGGVIQAGRQAVNLPPNGSQGASSPAYSPNPQTPGSVAYVPSAPPQGTTIRIATYNIQRFGDKKASNPNVMRILGAIVQNLDVLAIQEITTKDEYFIDRFLENYVNNKGRRYARVLGPRLGRTPQKEQYAILYDTAKVEMNPLVNYTVRDPKDRMHREPLVTMFRARANPPASGFTFVLVNAHTDPDEAIEEMDALAQLYRQVLSTTVIDGVAEDDVILLGDLNTAVKSASPRRRVPGARNLRPADMGGLGRLGYLYPVVQNQATNTVGSKLHDNILVHRGATTEFTGRSGVMDVQGTWGLSLKQAQAVSDHLPVWAEFSVYESLDPGRMARQPGASRR